MRSTMTIITLLNRHTIVTDSGPQRYHSFTKIIGSAFRSGLPPNN